MNPTEFDMIALLPESDRALLRTCTEQVAFVPSVGLVAIASNVAYAGCLKLHFSKHSSADIPILISCR